MDPLLDTIQGAEHRDVAGVRTDIVRAGSVRVVRVPVDEEGRQIGANPA